MMQPDVPDIILHGSHPALATARDELLDALSRDELSRDALARDVPSRAAPSGSGIARIHLGLFAELPGRDDLIRRGLIELHNTPDDCDAFAALLDGDSLYLTGTTPRGALHAVYALDEQLAFEGSVPTGWHTHGRFRIAERHFHPRFDRWPGERADIRFLSRLGASHCLVSHDWQGSLRSLSGFVTSPIFPEAIPPDEVARNRVGLERLVRDCRDYGLGMSLWITELPCQGGPWVPEPARNAWLERFPPEVVSDSGTYQGKVLCFSHPRVQAFYRDLLERFFRLFPQIETLYLFGMDSGGEGCDPESCRRCRGMSKFEQRDRLIRFLSAEGEKVRPGLRVLTTGWHWESMPDEFIERQGRLPEASGVYLAAESDGWQAERQQHEFLRRVRKVCRRRRQLFIGYDDFHLGDDATHLWGVDLEDFPLGVGAKIERWHDLGVDGVFDHWGTFSEQVPSNSVACREFFLNPLADREAICRRIADRQYGTEAGACAFQAWEAIERAQQILSNCTVWAPGQWPAWYRGRTNLPTPETFRRSFGHDDGSLVAKRAFGFTYNGGSLGDQLEAVATGWRLASPCLLEASRLLETASRAVDADAPVGYSFWWNGRAASLSRREHLARHRIYVEFLALLGSEIGIHFELRALYERLGGDDGAWWAKGTGLLTEDERACRSIVSFCDRLLVEYPQTGTMSAGRWRAEYAAKAEGLHAMVGGKGH